VEGQVALLSSPRNSIRAGVISLEQADALAKEIRRVLSDVAMIR
jgi:hypothetical protein